jgi:peptidoglycan/xylan/chitin deacetylase (PgdA/CDA1 family)
VAPDRFAAQLEWLSARCSPVPFSDVIAGLDSGLEAGAVALTFDDGYADNLVEAKPLLEVAGVPATVFIATGRLDGRREFWWDELEQLFLAPVELPRLFTRTIAGRQIEADLGSDTARRTLFEELLRLLRRIEGDERDKLIDGFWEWAGREPEVRVSHRPLDAAGVAELASGGLVGVGAHTVSHPGLSRLSRVARSSEIADSRRDLEAIIDRPVLDFAYPFGDRRGSRAALKRCGMRSACTTRPGRITAGIDRYRLPRIRIGDWDVETLARTLESPLGERRHAS